MTLRKRVDRLEERTPPLPSLQVILHQSVSPPPPGEPVGEGTPCYAHVLGGKGGPGFSLRREDEESEEAFLARVETERLRAHGTIKQVRSIVPPVFDDKNGDQQPTS